MRILLSIESLAFSRAFIFLAKPSPKYYRQMSPNLKTGLYGPPDAIIGVPVVIPVLGTKCPMRIVWGVFVESVPKV